MNRVELKSKARQNVAKDKFTIMLVTLIALAIMSSMSSGVLDFLPVNWFDGGEFLTIRPATEQALETTQTASKSGSSDKFNIDDFTDDNGDLDVDKFYGQESGSSHSSSNPFSDWDDDDYESFFGDFYDDYYDDTGYSYVNVGNAALSLVVFLITGAMMAGLYYFHRKVWRGEAYQFKDIFAKFDKDFPRITKMYLLKTLYVALWTLLFIIPGIVMSIAYSQAYFLMLDDPDLSATDALNKSKELMKGRKWDYFVLYLSFLGWFILSMLTFGILFIWVAPYLLQTLTGFYEEVITPAKLAADEAAAVRAAEAAAAAGTANADGVTYWPPEPPKAEPAAPEAAAPEAPAEPETAKEPATETPEASTEQPTAPSGRNIPYTDVD